MHYNNDQILEAFKKLPEDVKEAMFSVDTAEIIQGIGTKHKLMIDKIGELADETGLVMLGFTHPSEYVSHLAERLRVEHGLAKEIAEEINSKIFFPIRENLKKIHGIEKESLLPSMPETATIETTLLKPEPEETLGVKKPQTPSVEEIPPGIFESKTKEEIFRSPMETSEKTAPETASVFEQLKIKKVDPYHEPLS